MMHKAWCSIEVVPYYFLGSSIKFQGHTGWKIDDFNSIWVRLLGRSQLSNPSELPCSVSIVHHLIHRRFIINSQYNTITHLTSENQKQSLQFRGVNGWEQILSHKFKLKWFSVATRSRSSLIELMKHLANIPSFKHGHWWSAKWPGFYEICDWTCDGKCQLGKFVSHVSLCSTKGRRPAGPLRVCVGKMVFYIENVAHEATQQVLYLNCGLCEFDIILSCGLVWSFRLAADRGRV